MPSPSRPLPKETSLDDLDDYDIDDLDDPFSDNYVIPGSKQKVTEKESTESKDGEELGLTEIKVAKKPRAPRVKLDEQRLLSSAGIPKLRKKAAANLKFKGKGHEYTDAARLLSYYQLWLDDLFPKAKFLDALAMVEKLGHKKMIQSARMDWINEGKPKDSVREDSIFGEPEHPPPESNGGEKTTERETREAERPKTPARDLDPDLDDMYDATPKVIRPKPSVNGASIFGNGPAKATAPVDDVPDDDLEALLAEETFQSAERSKPPTLNAKATAAEEDFLEDDLDALLAEEEAFNAVNKPAPSKAEEKNMPEKVVDEDMDAMEAMADMDMDW